MTGESLSRSVSECVLTGSRVRVGADTAVKWVYLGHESLPLQSVGLTVQVIQAAAPEPEHLEMLCCVVEQEGCLLCLGGETIPLQHLCQIPRIYQSSALIRCTASYAAGVLNSCVQQGLCGWPMRWSWQR
jgi:hypothetical protein